MQNTPHLRLVKDSQSSVILETSAERIRADHTQLVDRIGDLLQRAKPTIPEHETVTALKAIDAKLDQVLYLLRRKGVN